MNKYLKIILVIILVVIVGIISCWNGKKSTQNTLSNAKVGKTFYATIKEINGRRILVEGLEVNDISYRGEFEFTIDNTTVLEWRYVEIDISNLNIGNNISITFTGEILETYPAIITKVVRIQLLKDEK